MRIACDGGGGGVSEALRGGLKLLCAQWESLDILKEFDSGSLAASGELVESYRAQIISDLISEYDARYLWEYVQSASICTSEYFDEFLNMWRLDEDNHHCGLSIIAEGLYGVSATDIVSENHLADPDFGELAPLLTDEFSICAAICFDEAATVLAYREDVARYRHLSCPPLLKWFQLVLRDEAFHFRNAAEVLKYQHGRRLGELKGVLDAVVSRDLVGGVYRRTFLFDRAHRSGRAGLAEAAMRMVLNRCSRPS